MPQLPRFKTASDRLPAQWEKHIDQMVSHAIERNNSRIEREMRSLVGSLAQELLADIMRSNGGEQGSYSTARRGGVMSNLLGNWVTQALSLSGSQQQARSLDSLNESEKRR